MKDVSDQAGPAFVSAASLAGRPVPPRAWHVPDLIPAGTVSLLGGDGGTGKSTIALMLAVATVTGRPWLGRETARGGALYLSAEDPLDELHRRLTAITKAEDVDLADLDRLTLLPLADRDALLAVPDPKTGVLHPTGLLDVLEQRLAEERPGILILDSLADLHSANENDRGTARQLVGLLRGLAIRFETTVLVLAHPSLTGLSSGSGLSGSTAWSNSVRSRLFLERIVENGYEPDPDRRRLVVKKNNYARTGTEIAVRWQSGAFVAEGAQNGGTMLDRLAANAKGERIFLALLGAFSAEGRHVNATPGVNYAPATFARDPRAEGLTKRALETAMGALFASGRIRVEGHGRPSKRRAHIAEVQP